MAGNNVRRPLAWQVDENGCWIVTSHKPDKQGYINLKNWDKAHRIMYEKHHGPIPDGLLVRHKCDVKRCVNPEHLELGTHADNMRDASERNRIVTQRGSAHKLSILTEEQVLEIKRRLKAGERGRDLAPEYGVTQARISSIKTGKSWAWLEP